MALSAWLLLLKAPFPKIFRVILLTGSTFLYYNAVISRVYSVVVLLVVLLAVIYKDRFERPILYSTVVALLLQSHILMSGLGIGLLCEYVYTGILNIKKEFGNAQKNHRKNRVVTGFIVQLISLAALVLELRQTKNSFIRITPEYILNKMNVQNVLKNAGVFAETLWGNAASAKTLTYICIILGIYVVFLLCLAFIERKNKSNILGKMVIALFSFGAFFFISFIVRMAEHPQLAICFNIILLFNMWIIYESIPSDKSNIIVKISAMIYLVAVTVFSTWKPTAEAISFDYSYPFSNSAGMAYYISEYLPENSTVIVGRPMYFVTPASYLADERSDVEFISYYNGERLRAENWGIDYPTWDLDDISKFINKNYPDKVKVYLLTEYSLDNEKLENIYGATAPNLWDENFYLYQFIK